MSPERRPKLPKQRRSLLSPQELRFAEEYILDFDPVAASERAGIDPQQSQGMISRSHVQAAIQALKLRRASRTEIYADEVLRRWWLLATADAREFTQIRRVNCRQCWGRNHQYQYRDNELIEAEMRHDAVQAKLDNREEFNDLGGGGFDGYADPCRGPTAVERLLEMGVECEANSDHNCPGCDGMGEVTVWVNDSRHYTPAGAMLFNGVKVSRDGTVEIKHRDRDHALDMVAQHYGMLVTKNVTIDIDPAKLTSDQLRAVLSRYGELLKDGRDPPLLEGVSDGAGEEGEGRE